jgi:hypothetical protein
MGAFDLSKELPIRPFGFNVPCRQFIIEAQVTRDKRMPMVDEFSLRVIKLCDGITIGRFRTFFGFSGLEAQIVIADLQERSLVTLAGDRVLLHPAANELFRTAGSGAPQILEVEGWVNRLWFDLISQSMMVSPVLRYVSNLIELKQSVGKVDLQEAFAREAFHTNFRDYLKDVRKIGNPDHLSLYAITSVEPGRFSYAQITGHQVLRYDPLPKIENVLNFPDTDRASRLRRLTDAMTHALGQRADPDPSVGARADFARLTESSNLGSEYVDLRAWLDSGLAKSSPTVQPFIGSTYLEANRKAFTAMLERSNRIGETEQGKAVDLLWFRPGGSLWGTAEDLRDAMAEWRSAIRRISSAETVVRSTVLMPASVPHDQRRSFRRLFDAGLDAPAGLVSPSMEIVLIRGIGAMISVLAPLSSSAAAWIGSMTVRREDLERLEKRLSWDEKGKNLTAAWSARPRLNSISPSRE